MRFLDEFQYKRFGFGELLIPYQIKHYNKPYALNVFQQRLQGMIIPSIGFGLMLSQPILLGITYTTLFVLTIVFELLGRVCHDFDQKYAATWLLNIADTLASSCFQLLQGCLCLWFVCSAIVTSYRAILTVIDTDSRETLDPNELRDDYGEWALRLAAARGRLDVVQLLLNQGADIHMRNYYGDTALMLAAARGNINVVQLLLNQRADIHVRNNNGDTALMLAALRGNINVVQLLLNQDADIHVRSNDGYTALMWAALNGNINLVQLLLNQGAGIDVRNNDGYTALVLAARGGNINVVQLLLNQGADIHVRSNDDSTALMWAARNYHLDVADFLLRQGARFEGLNIYGLPETGASDFSNHIAQEHINEAEALLNANHDLLNQPNQFGQTPLMRAVICRQLGAVNWLIVEGADLNAASRNGFTAIYFAARTLLSHRHEDAEAQAPYREMLTTIAERNPTIDDHTQALIDNDRTSILDELINPHLFILK